MNVFAVDNNPFYAAEDLCDKHVVKMILETAQILCTVANQRGYKAPYKSTHINHPVVKWANESYGNWCWLLTHGIALCDEYKLRYNKIHKCKEIINQLAVDTLFIWPESFVSFDLELWKKHTQFVQCMPDQYKCENPVLAYRKYYVGEKSYFAKWKNRLPPKWYSEMLKNIT